MSDGPPTYVKRLFVERYAAEPESRDVYGDTVVLLHIVCPSNIRPDAYENYAIEEAKRRMAAHGLLDRATDYSCAFVFNVGMVLVDIGAPPWELVTV